MLVPSRHRLALLLGAPLVVASLGCGGSGDPQPLAVSSTSSGTSSGGPSCGAAVQPFGIDPGAGESVPDLEVTACDGTRVTLDELRCPASLTLLSVGAGWCQPCQEEAPMLEAAAAELGDEGVVIVQILFEDGDGDPATSLFCQQWTDAFDLTIPVYVDPLGQSTELFDQAATPLNVVVDREGRVLWSTTGLVPDLEDQLRQLLP
ncbi:MAG: TlpA family protein disulfide reductase [Deltaproteobacteria bacterium]|nr:TlpA family protein disulfide reductase [Deltaproteobacteria bacterium]